MGCAASSIDKEERVRVCKERKRLMKQLVGFRGEFADAQLAYLRALKNTGITLRQFTESESLELENTSYGRALPPSPPLTLPPSPPPPPPFGLDLRKSKNNQKKEVNEEEESIEIDRNNDGCTTPPPPIPSSTWDAWDPFESLSPMHDHSSDTRVVEQVERKDNEVVEQVEEENWVDTKTEFEDEEDRQEVVNGIDVDMHYLQAVGGTDVNMHNQEVSGGIDVNMQHLKLQIGEVIDDNSSMASWYTKDADNMSMVDCRRKKTLEGIVRELDDYFLKASACEKEIVIFMDISSQNSTLPQKFNENKRKSSSSARVFSALSWSRSSKSLQLARDATERKSSEPCRPGAHCSTLQKLCASEKKLYEEVRNQEIAKMEHGSKCMLLQKQDEENHDSTKTEKTRLSVESLETDIRRLQHSISVTSSSMGKLIDEELYPQLVALTSGLSHMWKIMYKCHQVQSHISHQLNHLTDCLDMDMISEYRRQAAAQLETEVTCWYKSLSKLMKSQQQYVGTLCKWIQLTDCCVAEDHQRSGCSAAARKLCEGWQLAFEGLPEKAASEAIRSFLSAIQSIIQQQIEEHNLQRKTDRLEKRLQKELHSLAEIENRLEEGYVPEDATSMNLGSKHPLSVKRAKTEALNKRLEIEKAKYLNLVQLSKTTTLNNLKTSLPNVFQALMVFASAFAMGFEAVHGHAVPDVSDASPASDASQTKD